MMPTFVLDSIRSTRVTLHIELLFYCYDAKFSPRFFDNLPERQARLGRPVAGGGPQIRSADSNM